MNKKHIIIAHALIIPALIVVYFIIKGIIFLADACGDNPVLLVVPFIFLLCLLGAMCMD